MKTGNGFGGEGVAIGDYRGVEHAEADVAGVQDLLWDGVEAACVSAEGVLKGGLDGRWIIDRQEDL